MPFNTDKEFRQALNDPDHPRHNEAIWKRANARLYFGDYPHEPPGSFLKHPVTGALERISEGRETSRPIASAIEDVLFSDRSYQQVRDSNPKIQARDLEDANRTRTSILARKRGEEIMRQLYGTPTDQVRRVMDPIELIGAAVQGQK